MAWLDQATAISSLRQMIYDGPTDKICANKKVLGVTDGINSIFKTFEFRRITDFSEAEFPLGIFLKGVAIDTGLVVQDDLASGIFQLSGDAIPTNRDSLTASYYYQWFVDAELTTFMQNATTWLGFSSNFQNIPDGLNAAALRFAAKESYSAAAMKYSSRMAEVYQLEDSPVEDINKSVQAMQSMADNFMDEATRLRDDYYTRQGQSLAPNFSFSLGRVTDPTPRR